MPVPGRRVLLGLSVIVVVAVSIVGITIASRPPDPKLDDWGEVPAFHLTDERGQVFSEDALRGRVTIVGFVFTRCDTICPMTSRVMQTMQDQTFDVGDRVKLLSFSVDPDYDTPPRLTAYAQHYQADPTRWRFVTGPAAQVRSLVEGAFMSSMQREGDRPDGVPNIAHRGYFLLVDPQLHIRGKFESTDPHDRDELIRAARFLARTMI